jgi:phospholipid-transporting ATPase
MTNVRWRVKRQVSVENFMMSSERFFFFFFLFFFLKRSFSKAGPERTCYANDSPKNLQQEFCDNIVITYKYNFLTFLPLFLFNQFKRVANIYFLLISILQLIPGLSPTGQFTTLLVLIFVLAINGIKEVYEDYKRHRDDNVVNNRPVQAIRDGVLVQMAWWQLQVGDMVKLQHKDNIPADCLLVQSSEDQGVVYVETSSLDGEVKKKKNCGEGEMLNHYL